MQSSRVLFAAFAVAGVEVVACTNPKADYDDYVNRTSMYRTTTEAGATDSTAPTTSVKGTYYLSCLPALAFADVSQLFRFYAESDFTPSMSGGGKITFKLTPLIIRDDVGALIPANTLTLKDEMKGVLQAMDVDVATSGKFTANFKTAMVDSHSNPISFRNITVENTTVAGIFQAAPDGGTLPYCGGLSGDVTAPIMQPLGPANQNPCLFVPAKLGDPLPMQQAADFMCPGI